MADIFLKFLNMSISASWLALVVVILRLLLKKGPKVAESCSVGNRRYPAHFALFHRKHPEPDPQCGNNQPGDYLLAGAINP